MRISPLGFDTETSGVYPGLLLCLIIRTFIHHDCELLLDLVNIMEKDRVGLAFTSGPSSMSVKWCVMFVHLICLGNSELYSSTFATAE